MNSNYGKPNNPQRSSGSLGSFDFDIGIGSNKPRSLNDQKNKTTSFSYAAAAPSPAQPSRPAWQPNKPSWTHQPAAGAGAPGPAQSAGAASLGGPTSMVGDIFGKSWSSSSTSTGSLGSGLGIGIAKKDTNLFGDLVSSALGGQGKGGSGNVPLKNATPAASASKTAYSMGNLADSLPKSGNLMHNSGSRGSGGYSTGGVGGVNWNGVNAGSKSATLGGPSMQNMAGGGGDGGGINTNKDPFSNLVGFGSKQQSGSLNSASKASAKTGTGSHEFGDFQNAPSSGTTTFSSSGFSANKTNFAASNMSFGSKMDDFGVPAKNFSQQSQTPVQSSGADSFDVLFSSSSGSASAGVATGEQQAVGVDDWGLDSDFGGGNEGGGTTTELEGLPPPPSGISALTAKNKGMDNQKQGQYADAIKWLSWAVILLEKAGLRSLFISLSLSMQKAIPYTAYIPASSGPPPPVVEGQGRPEGMPAAEELTGSSGVGRAVAENAVMVIGRRGCCMCHVAKRLLLGLGVNPGVYEVDDAEEGVVIKELKGMIGTDGKNSDGGDGGDNQKLQFPAVFVGGRLFGGLEKVMATHISGELVPILREAGALWL